MGERGSANQSNADADTWQVSVCGHASRNMESRSRSNEREDISKF